MQYQAVVRAVRSYLPLIAAAPIVAALTAYLISGLLAPVWEAHAILLVKPAQPITSIDQGSAAITSSEVAGTYAQLITSPAVLNTVIKHTRLPITAEQLAPQITVVAVPNTTVLDIAVRSTGRAEARDLANQLIDDFIASTQAISAAQFEQSTTQLRQRLDQTQAAIVQDQTAISKLNQVPSGGKPLTPDQQTSLALLQQQLASDQAQSQSLLTAESNAIAAEARSTDNVVIVARAVLPSRPTSPRPVVNAAIAAVIGLACALVGAIALQHFDQRIGSDEELAERTGLTILGRIPLAPKSSLGSARAQQHSATPAGEAYKSLRTNLLFSTASHDARVILVTSSFPAEGKSFTSANLGSTLAQAGYRTLIIDADFRRPTQHMIFGLSRAKGLSGLIVQEGRIEESAEPVSGVPNLWLLPAGIAPPNPSELLGSSRMRTLIQSVGSAFQYVVIDTPPVIAVADALVLATFVDAVLLVVGYGGTTYPAVKRAVTNLSQVNARLLGVVLNGVPNVGTDYYVYAATDDPAKGRRQRGRALEAHTGREKRVGEVPNG